MQQGIVGRKKEVVIEFVRILQSHLLRSYEQNDVANGDFRKLDWEFNYVLCFT